jgi:hypothetical protein
VACLLSLLLLVTSSGALVATRSCGNIAIPYPFGV